MELDAETFAEWEVDYIKVDGCYADPTTMDEGYPAFGKFLNKTGRPMVFSCSWPFYQERLGEMPNYKLIMQHCNLWRNWGDINNSYNTMRSIIKYFARNQDRFQPNAGPGHWNDPDMLLLGNNGLSFDQSRMQMAVWAILAAPLLMSTDLRKVTPEIKDILQNEEVIAINQDPLGVQGKRVKVLGSTEIWTRPVLPLSKSGHHSYAVAFVCSRRFGSHCDLSTKLRDFELDYSRGYQVRDLYEKHELGYFYSNGTFKVRINHTGVQLFKFTVL